MNERCIRCREPLDGAQVNNEHVLGAWLARRTDNTQMMIHDSRRQYGSLQIPVHASCNHEMRRIETTMASAFDERAPSALLDVPREVWGAWATKAMYGLVSISAARHGLSADSTEEEVGNLVLVRDLLVRLRSMFSGFLEGQVSADAVTVRAYRTLWDRQARDFTSWMTDENAGTLFVQLDGVAAFVSVFDSDYLDLHDDEFTRAASVLELNPLQITEIYCRHVAFLQARSSRRETVPVPNGDGFDIACEGTSVAAPPDPDFYRYLLTEKLRPGGGFRPGEPLRPSWLLDASGRPWHIPLEATRRGRNRRTRRNLK